LVQIMDRLVEGFQEAEGLRRDARLYDAAVVGLSLAGDEAALFHAVKEARHVWIVRNHTVSDGAAGQTLRLGPAKNTQDIILRAGKPGGFQELFGLLGEGVSGLQQS